MMKPIASTGVTLLMIKQKSAEGIVAKRPSQWMGHSEVAWAPHLNIKVSEEPVQLNVFMPD
jgi:hypothetical protein